jgi:hypothetical protein
MNLNPEGAPGTSQIHHLKKASASRQKGVVLGFLFIILSSLAGLVSAAEDDHWDTKFGAPGPDGLVKAMVVDAGNVYVTGSFTSAGETGCPGIAKWEGAKWAGFGSGFARGSGPVGFAVARRGSDLYVGGVFLTNIGGVAITNLGKWDGAKWSQVGGGINGAVTALLWKGNDLFVGGIFNQAGTTLATNIARWDGTNWFALGNGVYGTTNGSPAPVVNALALDANGDVVAGGNFLYAGAIQANNVARWDGANWSSVGQGVYNGGTTQAVAALALRGSDMYVAGVFRSASGVNATNIARWDGAQWHAVGGGPSGSYAALAVVGAELYLGGSFTNISGGAARNVARWNGASWEPLAPGTAGEILTQVYCLGTDGTNLYAGGDFVQAGTSGALGLAKWDGNRWSALASPKSQGAWLGPIAVAAAGKDLYVGGSGLITVGGLKPNRIAHWDGTRWDDMGGGVTGGDNRVYTILEDNGAVYVGGNFTTAGGVAARNVAWWDGANWHAMGSGLNSNVLALCFHQGQLFAGGAFSKRGDGAITLPGIARWDGSDWVDVPTISSWRINNVVNALLSDGARLYAGGNYFIGWFEPVPPFNGANVDNIGYWDGANWWPMGNGLSNTVNSLAIAGGDLYAGGSFTVSGPSQVRRLARWTGSAWEELGAMTNGTVSALAARGQTLYAAGSFSAVNGNTIFNRLAAWNGSSWSTMGSGLARTSPTSFSVAKAAVSGDDVYFVGTFNQAGGRPSSGIAHWNETVSFVTPEIRLLNAGWNASHQFQFEISGTGAGPLKIQASTNLVEWLEIYPDPVGTNLFVDPDSPGLQQRYYRVSQP